MEEAIVVPTADPLSLLHTYALGLPLGNARIYSLMQGLYYILLTQHRKTLGVVTDPMLMKSAELLEDEMLRWRPELIPKWAADAGLIVNTNWISAKADIIHDMIVHQVERESDYAKVFIDRLKKVNGCPEFLVCSANNELNVSTGWSASKIRAARQKQQKAYPGEGIASLHYPGVNALGQVLKTVAKNVLKKEVQYRFGIDELCGTNLMRARAPRRFSVLVLSDSQSKFLQSIDNGIVISKSGAIYGDLVDEVRRRDIDLSDFDSIVVNCGINDAQKPDHVQSESWKKMTNLLEYEARRRDTSDPQILVCHEFENPRFEKAYSVRRHLRWLQCKTLRYGIKRIDWSKDWKGGCPFVANGVLRNEYFERNGKDIHLNHSGFGQLWKQFTIALPCLLFVVYHLSPRHLPYSQETLEPAPLVSVEPACSNFEDDRNFVFSRKRKILP